MLKWPRQAENWSKEEKLSGVAVFPAPSVLARAWTSLTGFRLRTENSLQLPLKQEKKKKILDIGGHGVYHKKISEMSRETQHDHGC